MVPAVPGETDATDATDETDETDETEATDETRKPEIASDEPTATPEPVTSVYGTLAPEEAETDQPSTSSRSAQARPIAARLAPLLNGLEISQRDGAGATLVTVLAPTLSEDAVVRTAARLVPFLADARLPERVTQATVTATGATVVLTPFGAPDAGGVLLVTAVASRASLAWLERLSRAAAREAQVDVGHGKPAGPGSAPGAGIELGAAREQEPRVLAREGDAAHLRPLRERFAEQPEILAQAPTPRGQGSDQRDAHQPAAACGCGRSVLLPRARGARASGCGRAVTYPARAEAQVRRPRASNWNGTTCPPRFSSALATRCLRS